MTGTRYVYYTLPLFFFLTAHGVHWVLMEIKEESYENESGDTVMLPCIIMLAQDKDGNFNTIRNGSKRLVATIEGAIESGEIVLGQTPVRITYIGKVKNKTNQFKSDRWSVKPIIL